MPPPRPSTAATRSLPFRVEDRVDHPISLYAATKKADELMSETYAHLYRIAADRPALLHRLRPVGPARHGDVDLHAEDPRRRADPGLQSWQDAARFHLSSTTSSPGSSPASTIRPPDDGAVKAGGSVAPHRLYNIGNSRSEELMRMIALLEQACGRKASCEFLPMQPGDVPETFADIGAIAARISASQPRTTIDVGIPALRQLVQRLSRPFLNRRERRGTGRSGLVQRRSRIAMPADATAARAPPQPYLIIGILNTFTNGLTILACQE